MSSAAFYEISANWESQYALHSDRLIIAQKESQDDPVARELEQQLLTLAPGQSTQINTPPETNIPCYSDSKLFQFESRYFDNNHHNITIKPTVGRFYPKGLIASALHGHRNDITPFRLTRFNDELMTADFNHPLSQYRINFNATCLQHPVSACKSAQPSSNIFNDLLNSGPGLQTPCINGVTDFYSEYPFKREKESDDSFFYQRPRLIQHLDNCAIEQVKQIYQRLLKPGDKILDLMSSLYSHIPENLHDYEAIGLGMNAKELSANTQLNNFVIHDLNKSPILPFPVESFDAVICTASIEYLIQPVEVLQQLSTVCKTGATVVFTFSNRWFPGKQIKLWSEMHPFERQGLVLDIFIKSGCFSGLQTESIRGYARPATDRHYGKTKHSDPIFAVWGQVK